MTSTKSTRLIARGVSGNYWINYTVLATSYIVIIVWLEGFLSIMASGLYGYAVYGFLSIWLYGYGYMVS